MASRSIFPVSSMGRELQLLVGSFAPNGSSALVAASTKGKGFTVARTGVGTFLITLADKYADMVAAHADLSAAAASGNYAQVGAYNASAKTLVVRTVTSAGAATDVAAGADERVSFSLVVRNSSIA